MILLDNQKWYNHPRKNKKGKEVNQMKNEKDQPFDPDYLNRCMKTVVKENKEIREITIHGFRHTHCSLLFEAGATLKEVQDRLGHANSDIILKIYTHVTTEAKRETANKLALYLDS
ncbi:tyrosine-type recombinase/integrase [Enterococcus faecium]|uniref:tyrosine-type recombinase/integrase n=1 Tax=Enterococcus faecium TaxID=1352 RepID=UPI0035DB3C89